MIFVVFCMDNGVYVRVVNIGGFYGAKIRKKTGLNSKDF